MNLLLLLAVPSLTALSCMITGITLETVYPRLQRRHHLVGQLIVFPVDSRPALRGRFGFEAVRPKTQRVSSGWKLWSLMIRIFGRRTIF